MQTIVMADSVDRIFYPENFSSVFQKDLSCLQGKKENVPFPLGSDFPVFGRGV